MSSIQECRQDITRWPGTEPSYDSLGCVSRHIYCRPRLVAYSPENIAEGGVRRIDRKITAAKRDLRGNRRHLLGTKHDWWRGGLSRRSLMHGDTSWSRP